MHLLDLLLMAAEQFQRREIFVRYNWPTVPRLLRVGETLEFLLGLELLHGSYVL